MKYILLVFLILLFGCNTTPTLLDTYKNEISALKTEAEIDAYWKKLQELDQKVLLNNENSIKIYDSISITNLMRTSLMFETHGLKYFKKDNPVPMLNIGHSWVGEANVEFWFVILNYAEVSRKLQTKGVAFPDYELEGISLPFYYYTLFNQQSRYPKLLSKLKKNKNKNISLSLFEILQKQKKLNSLTQIEAIGKWQLQPLKTMKEDGFFEFVKMSDNSIYYRKNERLQKLELIKTVENTKFYRIEKEPFGWSFKLKEDGNLILIDEDETILINYSKF